MGRDGLFLIVQVISSLIGILIFWRVVRAVLVPVSDFLFGTRKTPPKREAKKEEKTEKQSFRRRLLTTNSHRLEYWSLDYPFWLDRLIFLGVSILLTAFIAFIAGTVAYFTNGFDLVRGGEVFFSWFKILVIITSLMNVWLWALVIFPSIIMWDIPFLIIGNSMQFRKKYEKALIYFEKAVSIFPSEYGNWKIGVIRQLIEERKLEDSSFTRVPVDYSQTLTALTKAIEIGNVPPRVYKQRAEILTEMGDFDGAFADYNRIKELNPRAFFPYMFARVYINRTIYKEIIGDRKGAIEDLNEALNYSDENKHIYNKRAKLKYWDQDYTGAIKDYSQVILVEKGDPVFNENYWNFEADYYLKILHEVINDYEGYVKLSKALIRKLELEKKPTDYLRKKLAEVMLSMGKVNDAIGVYEKASTIDQKLMDKYRTWDQKYGDGISNLNWGDNSNVSFPDFEKKSDYLRNFGRLDEAIKILNAGKQYIHTEAQKIEYFLALGRLKIRKWEYKEAIDAFFEAMEADLKGQFPEIFYELAILRRNQAEFAEAENLYGKYLELRKNNHQKIEKYMLQEFLEIQIGLRNYEGALDTLKKWSDNLKPFKWDISLIEKMIEIKEKAETDRILRT